MKKVIYLKDSDFRENINKIVVKISYKAVIVFFLFFFFSVFSLFKMKYTEYTRLQNVKEEKLQTVQVLRDKILILEKQIEELNTPEGVEKEARKSLNMVKKGEKIVRPVFRNNETGS